MRPGPYARHWAIAEQRRQELLSEVDMIWQIRNAHAEDPQPEAAPSRFSRFLDAVPDGLARALVGPVQLGLRPFQREMSSSIESPGPGRSQ